MDIRKRAGMDCDAYPSQPRAKGISMLIKEINREMGFASPATNGVVESGEGWLGAVILRGGPVKSATDAAMPDRSLASGEYPVQICGDFGMLAALCLAPAYSAFAVGDSLGGCGKVWAAAEFTLSLVAKSRGWPCETEDDHFDLLERLQAETGKYEDPDIVAGYLLACSYRDGAEYGFLEDYVIKGGLSSVRRFITELLSLTQESA